MCGGKTLTHRQLNSLLYSGNAAADSIQEQMTAAENAAAEGGAPEKKVRTNSAVKNIYDIPDEEFAEICDNIPIRLDEVRKYAESGRLNDADCVPGGADRCIFYRHINSLAAVRHEHSFFELCYVWRGSLTQNSNDTVYEIGCGEFIITPPGLRHTVSTAEKDSIIFNILIPEEIFGTSLFEILAAAHPLSRFLRNSMTGIAPDKPYVCAEGEAKPELKPLFKALTVECCEGKKNSLLIYGFLNQFFGIVMNDNLKKDDDYICEVMEYINNNYMDATLLELSKRIGYNEAYLSRIIKEKTGKTFSQLVRRTRIAYAQALLVHNDISVQEAGEIAGYCDYAGFARAFEKEKGMKPAEFRKACSIEKNN